MRPPARSLATPQPRPSTIPFSQRILGRQAGVGQFRARHLGKSEGPGGLQKKPVKRTAPATSVSGPVIFEVVSQRCSCPLPHIRDICFSTFQTQSKPGEPKRTRLSEFTEGWSSSSSDDGTEGTGRRPQDQGRETARNFARLFNLDDSPTFTVCACVLRCSLL